MLTQEQQDALSGSGAYRPTLPPASGSTFRPLPGEAGRPGSYMPVKPVQNTQANMEGRETLASIALFIVLGMLG